MEASNEKPQRGWIGWVAAVVIILVLLVVPQVLRSMEMRSKEKREALITEVEKAAYRAEVAEREADEGKGSALVRYERALEELGDAIAEARRAGCDELKIMSAEVSGLGQGHDEWKEAFDEEMARKEEASERLMDGR